VNGESAGDNLYVAFDDSGCRYGPSGSGIIDLTQPCQTTVAAGAAAVPQHPPTFGAPEFRSASFLSPQNPVLTVVLKNEDKPEQNDVFRFINSAAGAAILVALITGLFGTIITHLLQTRKFSHELKLQNRYKQAEENRTRLSKELDDERDLVHSAYQLVGRCLAAGDGLLEIATEGFQRPGPNMAAAKLRLWSNFEETEKSWKTERYSTGLLVKLHHPGQNGIEDIWAEIDDDIAKYFDACKQRYEEFLGTKTLVTAQQKAAIRSEYVGKILEALGRLTSEIAKARQSSNDDLRSAVVAAAVS
jgi:hypothetical protein